MPEPAPGDLDAALAVGATVDKPLQHALRGVGFDTPTVLTGDSAHMSYAPFGGLPTRTPTRTRVGAPLRCAGQGSDVLVCVSGKPRFFLSLYTLARRPRRRIRLPSAFTVHSQGIHKAYMPDMPANHVA